LQAVPKGWGMRLVDDWKKVVKKAWSIRLMILAGILSGIEVVVPFFAESIPLNLFAGLSFLAVSCAFVARLVAQKELPDE
jgi:hypothetical protein